MYITASSQTIKYYMETCGIELKSRTESPITGDIHNIVLNRPGDPVFMGVTKIECSDRSVLFTNTVLSYNNRKKAISDQMTYLEIVVRSFIQYARRNGKDVVTIVTDNDLLAEVMVDLSFALIKPSLKETGMYKGIMLLNTKIKLPY